MVFSLGGSIRDDHLLHCGCPCSEVTNITMFGPELSNLLASFLFRRALRVSCSRDNR